MYHFLNFCSKFLSYLLNFSVPWHADDVSALLLIFRFNFTRSLAEFDGLKLPVLLLASEEVLLKNW